MSQHCQFGYRALENVSEPPSEQTRLNNAPTQLQPASKVAKGLRQTHLDLGQVSILHQLAACLQLSAAPHYPPDANPCGPVT
jgi:hypothetical protein